LPALAVQWGPIGDAGYLARDTRVSDMLGKLLGARHLQAAEALDALPALLAAGRPVVGLADVAWGELRARLPGLAGRLWSEMPASERGAHSGASIRARLAEMTPDEAAPVVLEILIEELARILQQTPAAIDINRPIQEFGVDSLMAVELLTALEGRLGVHLPQMALSGGATLRAIPARLLASIQTADTVRQDEVAAAILRHENEQIAVGTGAEQ
jgi:acyl carrier protein